MIRIFLISTLAFALLVGAGAQNVVPLSLVGLPKEDVAELVKEHYPKFRKDASIIKQSFNYLKYVNGPRTKTWILYFTDEDICRTSKLVCDYGEEKKVLEEVREKFGPGTNEHWEHVRWGDTIEVEMIRQEWYFTIRESKKEGDSRK